MAWVIFKLLYFVYGKNINYAYKNTNCKLTKTVDSMGIFRHGLSSGKNNRTSNKSAKQRQLNDIRKIETLALRGKKVAQSFFV